MMKVMLQIWVPCGLGIRPAGNIWFFFQEHYGKMRQRLVSINSRTEIPEGKGFSSACEVGREGAGTETAICMVHLLVTWIWKGSNSCITKERWRVHNSVVTFAYGSWCMGWLACFGLQSQGVCWRGSSNCWKSRKGKMQFSKGFQ